MQNYKTAVLAGGCFWGEKWAGTHFARPCQYFYERSDVKGRQGVLFL